MGEKEGVEKGKHGMCYMYPKYKQSQGTNNLKTNLTDIISQPQKENKS